MKPTLKMLLITGLLFAGIYAATPLWLPPIFAGQLPSGWQLEKFEAGYPGISGLDINVLRVRAKLQAVDMAIAASDIRVGYQGLKTKIGSIRLEVFMQATHERRSGTLTLDGLSLPVTEFNGRLPGISVNRLQVALHHAMNIESLGVETTTPLLLDFQAFELLPLPGSGFHLVSEVNIEGGLGGNGQLEVDVAADSFEAEIRFPAGTDSHPWLLVSLEQTTQDLKTATRVQAVFDAGPAGQAWLNPLLAQSTGGVLTQLDGKLVAQADFAGRDLQAIENLSMVAENLLVELDSGTLELNAEFLARRDGEKVVVMLPGPAEIQYRDEADGINRLLTGAIPGLHRLSRPGVEVLAAIDAGSSFVIQTGPKPSLQFIGDIDLSAVSADSSVNLQTTDLHFGIENLSSQPATTANGLITLNWVEHAPVAYTSDELELQAGKLSLSSTGNLQITHQGVNFSQTDDFNLQLEDLYAKQKTGPRWLELNSVNCVMQGRLDFELPVSATDVPVNFHFDGPVSARHPVIKISGDGFSPPMTIAANGLSVKTDLSAHNSGLVSTGDGTFTGVHLTPLMTSAGQVDVSWDALDLLNMAGKLTTRTQGFTTRADAETWTGFDFDISYALSGTADVDGSGSVLFDAGPILPIEFAGNTQSERWTIALPATTIELAQLDGLLRVGHFELPASAKLGDGHIELQGKVVTADATVAELNIKGYDISASLLESNARNVSFTFTTAYGNTISANGPILIESIALAGGIDVSHIRAELNLENTDHLALKNLYAELFDGQLKINSLQFSDNTIEDTMVELTHIDLGQLLAFADINGLEGTGLLEISLPVGTDQTGIRIMNGTFSSTGPGRLAYTKAGVADGNIGLQALQNFQYDKLSGTLNYQSDGAYRITVHLEGKNPELHAGHPIVFNLNLSGSLPALFEALFFTGSFEESILKEIRGGGHGK